MKRFTLRLPLSLYDALKTLSIKKGRSLHAQILQILKGHIDTGVDEMNDIQRIQWTLGKAAETFDDVDTEHWPGLVINLLEEIERFSKPADFEHVLKTLIGDIENLIDSRGWSI